MTHLIDTIGSVESNRDGGISLQLNNLSNVSTSPTANQFLYHDGSGWIANTSTLKNTTAFSTPTTANESVLASPFYDTSYEAPFNLPMRTVTGTVATRLISFSNLTNNEFVERVFHARSIYFERVEIGANKNCLLAVDMCIAENSQTTAYLDLQWQTAAGTALGPIVRVRRTGYNRQTIYGHISTSGSSVQCGLKTIAISGNVGWPQSTATKNQFYSTSKFTA